MVKGLGFSVLGLGFGVWSSGFGVWVLEFGVGGSVFVWCLSGVRYLVFVDRCLVFGVWCMV